MRIIYLVIVMALVAAGAASALDFSADMVSTARGSANVAGKIFASGEKFRMEIAGIITITRIDKGVTWTIVPEQNMFIEQPMDISKVAGIAGKIPGELERAIIGSETVDGKMADKYRVVYTEKGNNVTIFQWVDHTSGIPVRTEPGDGSWSVEYNNLVVGVQSESLFEVPPQYAKTGMPNMADMMAAARQASSNRMGRQDEE